MDFNSKYITGTGGINLTGIVTATEAIVGTAVTINSGGINAIGISTLSSVVVGAAVTINSTGIDAVAGVVTAYALDAAIIEWTLGASGSSHYTFTGPGDLSDANDPALNLVRGQKYIFKNRSGGHPFRIQTSYQNTSGTAYNDGVTNNSAGNGTDLIFDVPYDAPNILYYQCTAHSGMSGYLYIGNSWSDLSITGVSTFTGAIDANGGANIAGGLVANSAQISDLTSGRVTYAGGSGELQDSGNLTFDGTDLTAASAVISDLTDNRVVIAGSSGALEDDSNLTFNGSTLSVGVGLDVDGHTELDDLKVTGVSTLSSVIVGTAVTINSTGIHAAAGIITATTFKGSLTGDVTGDVTGDLTGNADTATLATNVTVSANNSTNETVYPIFVDGATGTQGVESDTGLSYNPSSGNLTSTQLTGTLQTAAQTNITSVGTLSSLDVTGNVTIGGTLSYDDVTNVDSIGFATFRKGIEVQGAGSTTTTLNVTGVSTLSSAIVGAAVTINSRGIDIAAGVITATTFDGNLATTNLTGTITNAQLAGSIANDKLSNNSLTYTAGSALTGGGEVALGASATLNVAVDDSSIEVSSDALRVKASGITNAMLAGSIANDKLAGSITNAKLAHSSVNYGGISLSLGGSDTTPAFDLTDATNYPTSSLTGTITNAQLAGSIANAKLSNSTVAYGGVELALGAADTTPAFNLQDATAYPYGSLTGIQTHIVGDTTPQLGGNLDFNSKYITGTGGINLSGVATATTFKGNLTGDVTGDVTGDLTGDVTGDVTGDLTGSVDTGQSVIAGVTATKTSTSIASIDTFSASTYRSANYQIQVVRGTNYNMTTINIIHDGTNTYMTEFGSITQPVGIATFGSDISSGNVRILATPTTSDSTVFKIVRTLTKV